METVLRSKMYADLDRPCLDRAELFFAPDNHVGRKWNPAPAKQLCRTCPHTDECLERSLAPGIPMGFGVWGGLDEDERQVIRNCRRHQCPDTCTHPYRERRF